MAIRGREREQGLSKHPSADIDQPCLTVGIFSLRFPISNASLSAVAVSNPGQATASANKWRICAATMKLLLHVSTAADCLIVGGSAGRAAKRRQQNRAG